MPHELFEGEKRTIAMRLDRLFGNGQPTGGTPQFRILNSTKTAEISGFTWAGASYDATTRIISALFDATNAGLLAPGDYYMQFRINPSASDRRHGEVKITVMETGP